ncbi:MAG: threonine/serine exporter family protein [Clostridiales bacterium]|nr:threonine/serine exporter family protein [Clostridiales bacterium]
MKEMIIQIISAFVGSLGFAILYNVKKTNLVLCMLGGGLTWIVCLCASAFSEDLFVVNIIAGAFGACYSEIMAGIRKVPKTIFILPSIIPLVPGSGLYYSMIYLFFEKQRDVAETYGKNTFLTVSGIAAGLVIVSVIFKYVRKFLKKRKKLKEV